MATSEAIALAAELLRQKEGLRSKPYWDVNALRAGYGSDTVTRPDGSVQRVAKDTVVTKEDAERDLARRVTDFANIAQREIGANFSNLTPQAQAAITSVAYNYGTTKKVSGLVTAAQAGDNNAIAKALTGAAGHNGGVNKQRRLDEAAIVLGKKQLTANPLSIDTVAGYNGSANIPNPQSQLGDVRSYNQEMVQAAQKIADNKLAAVNNFGWNPTVDGSQAQTFGKTVSTNTDTLSQLYDRNMQHLQAFTTPTKDTYLGRVGDKVKAAFNISGNVLTEEYLKRAEASQSGTGKAMADQVTNMKTTMDGTVIDPAYLDKAAGNLTQQQQAENQTYSAVTGNANTQQQLKQQYETAQAANAINQQQVDVQKGKLELEVNAANAQKVAIQKAAEFTADMNSRVQAASKGLGFDLPANTTYDQAMQLIVDPTQKAMFASKVLNGGANANNLYDAVKIGQMPGASDNMRNTANKYAGLIDSVLSTPEARAVLDGVPDPATGVLTGGVSDPAQRDAVKRTIISKAMGEMASGSGSYAVKSGANNPYSMYNRDPALLNGVKLPEGVEAKDLPNAVKTLQKATETGLAAGKSVDQIATEVAAAYTGYRGNIQGNLDKDGVKLPPMKMMANLGELAPNGKNKQVDLTNVTDIKLLITKMKMDTTAYKGNFDIFKFLGSADKLGEFNARGARQGIEEANRPVFSFANKDVNIADKK